MHVLRFIGILFHGISNKKKKKSSCIQWGPRRGIIIFFPFKILFVFFFSFKPIYFWALHTNSDLPSYLAPPPPSQSFHPQLELVRDNRPESEIEPRGSVDRLSWFSPSAHGRNKTIIITSPYEVRGSDAISVQPVPILLYYYNIKRIIPQCETIVSIDWRFH